MSEPELEQDDGFDFDGGTATCGLSELQRKFARSVLDGANHTQAARVAGYSGTDDQLRAAGYKAFNSPKVQAFLALAKRHGFGVPEHPGDLAELERILWKHARGDDKSYSIQASRELRHLEAEKHEAEKNDPVKTLHEIAELVPEIALELAAQHKIKFELSEAQRERLEARRREIALDYIKENRAGQEAAA